MIALLIRSCLPDSKCLDSMRFWSAVPRARANPSCLIDFCTFIFNFGSLCCVFVCDLFNCNSVFCLSL